MRPPADAAGNTRPQADLWWAMRGSADVYKGQCEGNAGQCRGFTGGKEVGLEPASPMFEKALFADCSEKISMKNLHLNWAAPTQRVFLAAISWF